MTEIPAHLLKRSAERKAALTGADPAADADAGSAVATATSTTPAVAAATTPIVAPEPEPEPPARVAPYVDAYKARKKMPFWIIPVLLTLPIWGAMYIGTLERVPQGLAGLLGEGEEIYVEAGCSGCHGAEGGGGIGPQFANGEIHTTFTTIEDQMAWILKGSAIVGAGNTYSSQDSTRPRAVTTGMPGFGVEGSRSLSVEELLSVTLYVRTQFHPDEEAAEIDLELAEQMDELIETGAIDSLGDVLAGEGLTADVIATYLAPARSGGEG